MHSLVLANHLGLSIQAVRKVLEGKSAAFNVPNHFKACAFLGVDAEWLATGEGKMVSEKVWPLVLLSPEQVSSLSAEHLKIVEDLAISLLLSKGNPETFSVPAVNTEVKGSRVGEIHKLKKDEALRGKRDSAPKETRRPAGGG